MERLGRRRGVTAQVLLIGNCDAGKTSMRSIIFANYEGKDALPAIHCSEGRKAVIGNLYPFDRENHVIVSFIRT